MQQAAAAAVARVEAERLGAEAPEDSEEEGDRAGPLRNEVHFAQPETEGRIKLAKREIKSAPVSPRRTMSNFSSADHSADASPSADHPHSYLATDQEAGTEDAAARPTSMDISRALFRSLSQGLAMAVPSVLMGSSVPDAEAPARSGGNTPSSTTTPRRSHDTDLGDLAHEMVRDPEDVCKEVLKLRAELKACENKLKEKDESIDKLYAQNEDLQKEVMKLRDQVKPASTQKLLAEETERLTMAYVPLIRELSEEIEDLKRQQANGTKRTGMSLLRKANSARG
mmetsp:Transcript_31209/g.48913  ORF Transcript_31209/g.48913 Transcript_31209/m.48913 type:complete len:283 (+) Transcript_31209:1093-1941(+)